jgi:hypothetical protein
MTSKICFGASGYYQDQLPDSFLQSSIQAGILWARIEGAQASPYVTISQFEAQKGFVYSNLSPGDPVAQIVASHPEIEVWGFINEPMGMGGNLTPQEYTPQLNAFYDQVKAANPNAKVSAFEASWNPGANNAWVQDCVDLGAKYDLASLHVYPGQDVINLSSVSSDIDAFYNIVKSPIIIGEANICGGGGNYFGSDPVADTNNFLSMLASKTYIVGIFWYQINMDWGNGCQSLYNSQNLTPVGQAYLSFIQSQGGSATSLVSSSESVTPPPPPPVSASELSISMNSTFTVCTITASSGYFLSASQISSSEVCVVAASAPASTKGPSATVAPDSFTTGQGQISASLQGGAPSTSYDVSLGDSRGQYLRIYATKKTDSKGDLSLSFDIASIKNSTVLSPLSPDTYYIRFVSNTTKKIDAYAGFNVE